MQNDSAAVAPAADRNSAVDLASFQPRSQARKDPRWVRYLLVGTTYLVIGLLVAVPLAHVFFRLFLQELAPIFKNCWATKTRYTPSFSP